MIVWLVCDCPCACLFKQGFVLALGCLFDAVVFVPSSEMFV